MDLRTVAQGPALRAIFFAHLVPVVWAMQSNPVHSYPLSYGLYNSLFLLTLLWSLHSRDSEDAAFMSSALNVLSIVLDAITIGIYYDSGGSSFSNFMAIVNLLLRPITSLILLRFYNERAGHLSAISFPGLPAFGTTGFTDRGSYEDLERSRLAPQQSVPTHHSSPDPQIDILTK